MRFPSSDAVWHKYLMTQARAHDTSGGLGAIIGDGEIVACVLGRKYVTNWAALPNIKQGILVLTDKSLHHVGTSFQLDDGGVCKRNTGRYEVAVADLMDIRIVDIPLPRWVALSGSALLGIGAVLFLTGIIDGSAFGMLFGAFVGAFWMMIPGALLLFSATWEGKKFIDITHRDGAFALSCRWHPQEELDTFREHCAAQIFNHQKMPITY